VKTLKKRLAILAAPPFKGPEEVSDFRTVWGNDVEIILSSIIPERTEKAIKPFLPGSGDRVLMFVLEDGTHTTISIDKLVPAIEKRLQEMQDKVDLVFLACGGDFPKLNSPIPFIQPNIILRNMISGMLFPHARVGVITPDQQQVWHVRNSWLNYIAARGMSEDQLHVDWAPPFREIDIKECAKRLEEKKVDFVVVECLGYKDQHKKILKQELNDKPVILIRTVMANLIKELL